MTTQPEELNFHKNTNNTICNLFELVESCDATLYSKDELLRICLNDLDKVYNSTIDSSELDDVLESKSNTINDDRHGPNLDSVNKENKFKECQQKALETLLKAEQLNAHLDAELKLNQKSTHQRLALDSLDQYQTNKQAQINRLLHLYTKFELNVDENKLRKLSDFVGMQPFGQYLDQTLGKLTDQWSPHEAQHALVYSPAPSAGKMSFLLSYLHENGYVKVSNGRTCATRVKIFLIDFDSLTGWDANMDDIVNSIELYANKKRLGSLVIIKNFNQLNNLKLVGDLLFQLSKTSPSSYLPFNETLFKFNKMVFLFLTHTPWSLPLALTDQLTRKICIPPLDGDELRKLINDRVEILAAGLQSEWLYQDEFEKFVRLVNLTKTLHNVMTSTSLHFVAGIVCDFFQKCENIIRKYVREQIIQVMTEKKLDVNKFDHFNLSKITERRKSSVLRSHWTNVRQKLSVIRRFSYGINTRASDRIKKSSLVEQASTLDTFNSIKTQLWLSIRSQLSALLIDKLNDFLAENTPSEESIENFRNFTLNSSLF